VSATPSNLPAHLPANAAPERLAEASRARELQDWPTYKEIAHLLLVSPKTVANRVSKHKLRHVLVPQGKAHRRVARVAPSAVRALAVLIGTLPLSEEEPVMRAADEAARVAGGLDEDEV
jgi:hypothetical protein